MRSQKKTEFVPANRHAVLSTGEVIRMLRELKGWTQAELAQLCGIRTTFHNQGMSINFVL